MLRSNCCNLFTLVHIAVNDRGGADGTWWSSPLQCAERSACTISFLSPCYPEVNPPANGILPGKVGLEAVLVWFRLVFIPFGYLRDYDGLGFLTAKPKAMDFHLCDTESKVTPSFPFGDIYFNL